MNHRTDTKAPAATPPMVTAAASGSTTLAGLDGHRRRQSRGRGREHRGPQPGRLREERVQAGRTEPLGKTPIDPFCVSPQICPKDDTTVHIGGTVRLTFVAGHVLCRVGFVWDPSLCRSAGSGAWAASSPAKAAGISKMLLCGYTRREGGGDGEDFDRRG